MKTKAFLFAAVLTLLYYVITVYRSTTKASLLADQGQWSQNVIKAEKMLYGRDGAPYNCIVGTSLSARLPAHSLPPHYINLAFSAQGVVDGLEVLRYCKKLPDTLFIETNYISKLPSDDFIKKVASSKTQVMIKGALPFLQEQHLPLGVMANYLDAAFIRYAPPLQNVYNSSVHILRNKMRGEGSKDTEQEGRKQVFDKMLSESAKKLSVISLSKEQLEVFETIKARLKELEKESVTLVFYEMPVECSLERAPLFAFNKELLRNSFLPSRYPYLVSDGCQKYTTNDGTHLDVQSAQSFALYLVGQIHDSLSTFPRR